MHAGIGPFGPVEVHPALAILLEDEAGVGVAGDELGVALALGHGVRLLVQVGAVHGVHDVVQHVAVVAAPLGVAEEVGELGVGQLLGQHQRRRLLEVARRVVQPDRAGRLGDVEETGGLAAFQLAAGAAGHAGGDAVAAHFHAVVGALQAVAQVHPARQRRATVRAVVFEGVQGAVGVAPEGQLVAQATQGHRFVFDEAHRADRVPEVLQAIGEEVFNRVHGAHIGFLLEGIHSPRRAIRVL
ncbi:hypothetical protein D3C81_1443390 [compost metagenome]